jgi:hypothetical protein
MSEPLDKKRLSIAALQAQDEARRRPWQPTDRRFPDRDPNTGPVTDEEFDAACDPANFSDLQSAAAAEISRQIRNRDCEGATKLTRLGFGWSTALEVQRAVVNGTSPSLLFARGIPGRAARNIATAAKMGRKRYEAILAAAAAPGHNTGRTFPRKDYKVPFETHNGETIA